MSLLDCQNHQRSSVSTVLKNKTNKQTTNQNTKTISSERNCPFSALGWEWEGHLNNSFPVISNVSICGQDDSCHLDLAICGLVLLALELASACITVYGLSLGKGKSVKNYHASHLLDSTGYRGKKSFIATQEFISSMNKEDKGVVRDKLCFGYWVHKSPTTAQE